MRHRYAIQVTFPRLKVKDAVQQARVEAASLPQAVRLTLKEILRRPGVKGKQHRQLALTVSRLEEPDMAATASPATHEP